MTGSRRTPGTGRTPQGAAAPDVGPGEAVRPSTSVVGDDRVRAATGRDREEWFARLDDAGARAWDHTRTAAWLVEVEGVDGWWAQSVTVAYEQARGRRLPGQQRDGTFAASASVTVPLEVSGVWPLLVDPRRRAGWLEGEVDDRGATEHHSVRLTVDGRRVALYVQPAPATKGGEPRSRVAVQVEKLPGPEEAAAAKATWRAALARLKESAGRACDNG